jgi:hypothetical protein
VRAADLMLTAELGPGKSVIRPPKRCVLRPSGSTARSYFPPLRGTYIKFSDQNFLPMRDSRPCVIRQQLGIRFARHTFSRCICPSG